MRPNQTGLAARKARLAIALAMATTTATMRPQVFPQKSA